MRIAIILGRFPSLSETFILRRITGLIDKGHDVEVFARLFSASKEAPPEYRSYRLYERCSYLDEEAAAGVGGVLKSIVNRCCFWLHAMKLLPFRSVRRRSFHSLASGLRQKLNADYDVVYAAFGTNAVRVMKMQDDGLLRGPLVVSFHGYDLSASAHVRKPAEYDALFSRMSFALPVCRYFAVRLEKLGVDPAKIFVLPSGVEVHQIPFRGHHDFHAPVRLISAGRLVEKKGMSDILEAVDQLLRMGVDVHLSLVGSGPLREALEDQASQLPEGAVTFHGWISEADFHALLADSDIYIGAFIQAADGNEDTIPNVMKEAMSVGVPVIATNRSGTPELVDHDENGILVEPKQPKQIAAAVLGLIEHPKKVERLVANARKTVEDGFESNRINDRLEEILKAAAELPS